jgi:ribosome-associated protein
MRTTTPSAPPDLLRQLVLALDAKQASDLRVLDVSAQSTITDWLVLATGNSEPHLRALRIEVEKILDAAHAPIAGMDGGGPDSGWTVVDAYQIMVHLFTAEPRNRYALERLWKDAVEVKVKTLLAPPVAPKTKKKAPARASRKTKVVKKAPAKKKPAAKKSRKA